MTVMPTGIAVGHDCVTAEKQSAQTWGMHRIAVLQAAAGDLQDAKHTLSQIDEEPSAVFEPSLFDCLPDDVGSLEQSPGWGGYDALGIQYFLAQDRPADRVPIAVPAGLPADYLDPDPRHGAVVSFTDESDSRGTRVTSRRYADGHVMIDTPRAVN